MLKVYNIWLRYTYIYFLNLQYKHSGKPGGAKNSSDGSFFPKSALNSYLFNIMWCKE